MTPERLEQMISIIEHGPDLIPRGYALEMAYEVRRLQAALARTESDRV